MWQPDVQNNYRTGLMHLGCRYYDAELGRFIQPDPLLGNPYNPQSLNRYTYCANSPVNAVDPAGRFFGGPGDVWDYIYVGGKLKQIQGALELGGAILAAPCPPAAYALGVAGAADGVAGLIATTVAEASGRTSGNEAWGDVAADVGCLWAIAKPIAKEAVDDAKTWLQLKWEDFRDFVRDLWRDLTYPM